MNFVFDNVIFSKEQQGGISNYWSELVNSYAANKKAFFYEETNALHNIFRKSIKIDNLIPHYQLPLHLARLLPIYYKTKNDRLLYHSSFYRQLITNAEVREITTIHDFTHSVFSTTLKRVVHNKLKFSSLKRSRGIICISHNTFKDMKRYYVARTKQKVAVIYNGVSRDYKPLAYSYNHEYFNKFDLNQRFLLFVGSRSNYKNFDFVVKLAAQLLQYRLIIVGKALNKEEKLTINKSLMERIIVVNSISNEDLNVLYNNAHALLYPSSYEGFGIPVVEAMKAGCPVLALNTTSIPEVSGGAAILFDTLDIAQFMRALAHLESTSYRSEYIAAGFENAKRFDWSKCVNQTKEFYEEVCSSQS